MPQICKRMIPSKELKLSRKQLGVEKTRIFNQVVHRENIPLGEEKKNCKASRVDAIWLIVADAVDDVNAWVNKVEGI